jgi:hypothetical protein
MQSVRSLIPHVVLRRPQIRSIRRGFHTTGFDRDSLAIAKPDATRFSEQALNDRLGLFVLAFAKVMLANASARDGVYVGEDCLIMVLGIAADGQNCVLGLWEESGC